MKTKKYIVLIAIMCSTSALFAEPYSFKLIQKKDISYGATKRMVYRIYLDTTVTPSEERMKETAQQIWKNGNQRWNEFTVWMIFGPIKNFDTGAYGIAEFRPSGLKEFRVNDVPLQMLELKKTEEYKNLSSQQDQGTNLLDVRKLKVGQAFYVSKKTPLMPEVDPVDPLAAIELMKYIPSGGAFKIEELQNKKTERWYRVVAIDSNKNKIGTGWINSTALLCQRSLKVYHPWSIQSVPP